MPTVQGRQAERGARGMGPPGFCSQLPCRMGRGGGRPAVPSLPPAAGKTGGRLAGALPRPWGVGDLIANGLGCGWEGPPTARRRKWLLPACRPGAGVVARAAGDRQGSGGGDLQLPMFQWLPSGLRSQIFPPAPRDHMRGFGGRIRPLQVRDFRPGLWGRPSPCPVSCILPPPNPTL